MGDFIHTNGAARSLTSITEDNAETLPSGLFDVLRQQLDLRPEIALVDWNDAPERTKQEVIDLFKNTAKGLRNGEIVP